MTHHRALWFAAGLGAGAVATIAGLSVAISMLASDLHHYRSPRH